MLNFEDVQASWNLGLDQRHRLGTLVGAAWTVTVLIICHVARLGPGLANGMVLALYPQSNCLAVLHLAWPMQLATCCSLKLCSHDILSVQWVAQR